MNLQTFKRKEFYTYLIPILIADLLVQLAVYKMIALALGYVNPEDAVMLKHKVVYFLMVGYLFSTIIIPPTIYRRNIHTTWVIANAFFQTLIAYLLFAFSINFLFDSFYGSLYLYCGIAGTAAVSLTNILARMLITLARRKGRNKIHVVIVGSDENAVTLYHYLEKDADYQFKVLGMFTDYGAPADIKVLGGMNDIEGYLNDYKVHALYCSIPPAKYPEVVNPIVNLCDERFVQYFYVPNMDGYPKRRMKFSRVGDINVCCLREEPLRNPVNRFWKRTMDLVICAVFFTFFFPWLYLIIATGIKLSSPGPVFFKQKRTGYHGKPFYLYKFRSMRVNADADKLQATADDPRKTKFGDFLRRSSLDELPQFINVLKGDMSAIGPRPHMEKQTVEYEALIDKYMLRHLCKPGISGWAQVNGYRGETKDLEQMVGRVKYDIWYIENWSLWLDLKIFIKTIIQCVIKDDKQAY